MCTILKEQQLLEQKDVKHVDKITSAAIAVNTQGSCAENVLFLYAHIMIILKSQSNKFPVIMRQVAATKFIWKSKNYTQLITKM